MFTVLFAMGLLPGWIAQWKEMSEYHSKEVRRLEFERWTNKLNELERRVDYLDTKLRSKLDSFINFSSSIPNFLVLGPLSPHLHSCGNL